jgi:hypothetical protein
MLTRGQLHRFIRITLRDYPYEQRFAYYQTLQNKSGKNTLPYSMSSTIKLEKFKGDGTQNVNAWYTNFCQWAEFHELPERKLVGAFPFNLEGQAKSLVRFP